MIATTSKISLVPLKPCSGVSCYSNNAIKVSKTLNLLINDQANSTAKRKIIIKF